MYNERNRAIFIQVIAVILFLMAAYFFASNAAQNLQALGLASGFGFLDQPAGFDISFSVIPYDKSTSSYWRVFFVGITNTLAVSAVAIVLATFLGTIVGILQLLGNWPLTKVCRAYIELARNIPLLLQLLFWYTMALYLLPHQRASLSAFEAFFLNVRGLYLPSATFDGNNVPLIIAIVLGVAAWVLLARRADKLQRETGKIVQGHSLGILSLLALIVCAFLFSGSPITWDVPALKGFNFKGGLWLPPEFVALLIGLTVYSAAFIAELVRGGITAISSGQREAANALGLSNWQTMRLVMIPQAMRIIVPPMTSQYLNIVKNSSLAVAIAYPDIVSVFTGTALNQTGRAIEIVAMTMGFYLFISLSISAS